MDKPLLVTAPLFMFALSTAGLAIPPPQASYTAPTTDRTKTQLNDNREMVYQNYNHPAIIFWSAGNESSGVAAVLQYAAVIKDADSSRPVVYASDGQTPSRASGQ